VSDKVRDLELNEFVARVIGKDDELAKQVKECEIDAEAIIGKAKPSINKYGIATGVAYAVARLKEAVLEASSEEVKGLLVGQRDRFGTNSPARIPLLSSTGSHMELINWSEHVKHGDAKIDMPYPSVATVKVINEGDYKGIPSIRLVAMESYEKLSVPDTILRLNKVAKSVGEIDAGDELRVVVVKGRINFIAPATRWKDKEKDGNWQIYMPNQKDTPVSHPVMQISLEAEAGNQVRAVFDRQKNSAPSIVVEDFVELCMDAVTQSTDPTEQAKFVGEIMKGRDVVIVGFMTKYNQQATVNYIDIGAYAMYDGSTSAQASLDTKPEGKKSSAKPPAKKSVKEDAAPKKSDTGKESPIDKLKKKIRSYCEICNVGVKDITADEVIKGLKLEDLVTKGSVETLLEDLRDEAE